MIGLRGHNSRAARRQRYARLEREHAQSALSASTAHARARQAEQDHAQITRQLRDVRATLATVERSAQLAVESLRRMTSLVGATCAAMAVPMSREMRHVSANSHQFYHSAYSYADWPRGLNDPDGGITQRSVLEVMRLLKVKAVRDHIGGVMHMHVMLDDGKVAYAISERALMQMESEDLIRMICAEMRHALVPKVKALMALKNGRNPVGAPGCPDTW